MKERERFIEERSKSVVGRRKKGKEKKNWAWGKEENESKKNKRKGNHRKNKRS